MFYPTEHDIEEYFAGLPTAVKDELDPLLEKVQPCYRRVWQLDPGEANRIKVLCELAGEVFKTRTAKRLRARSGDFAAFQRAISLESGEAELAFWFAHRLYNIVEKGRMLSTWHEKIQIHLRVLIGDAENLWYTPDVVPEGWESFSLLEPGTQGQNKSAPGISEGSPGQVQWEDLEICFLSDERVQITVGGQPETRNYAEMGFLDARSHKPTLAWIMLRGFAQGRGIIPARAAGRERVQIEKRIQELRKLLRNIHAAPGDPIIRVKGAGYQARFKVSCSRAYFS